MRLYKISAIHTGHDQPLPETHWVGSLADASAKRKQLTAEGWTRKEVETEEIDVPTDKAGLMAFLNAMSAA